jgi:hypothetical protein
MGFKLFIGIILVVLSNCFAQGKYLGSWRISGISDSNCNGTDPGSGFKIINVSQSAGSTAILRFYHNDTLIQTEYCDTSEIFLTMAHDALPTCCITGQPNYTTDTSFCVYNMLDSKYYSFEKCNYYVRVKKSINTSILRKEIRTNDGFYDLRGKKYLRINHYGIYVNKNRHFIVLTHP